MGVPFKGERTRPLGCAEPTHKRRVKYLMFFEGKARSRRGDLLALRGKGAVPPVQPAPVSVVIVGSPLMVCQDHRGVDQALAAEGGDPTLRGSAFFLGDSDRGVGTWWRCGSWAPCVKNRAVDRRVSRVPE